MPSEQDKKSNHNADSKSTSTSQFKKQLGEDVQKTVEKVRDYSKKNVADTIVYAILLLGVLLTIFTYQPQGLFIVGLVAGFYFGEERFAILQGVVNVENRDKFFPAVIMTGVLITLLVVALPLVLGVVGGFLIRKLVTLTAKK
jgi:ABC-type amino acid transport system permease subunit